MRPVMVCDRCSSAAVEWIRYSGEHLCRDHFLGFVERRAKRELRSQVHRRGQERIAIGMSGGKDSSTTAALLVKFRRSGREMELIGITIDEGIASSRPAGIDFAQRLCSRLGIEHRVLAYQETSGHTMDEVVARDPESIPCSYCGPFRRQALSRAAREVDADCVATGLTLDDTAQSILMNVARGDIEKLARLGPHESRQPGLVPRIQPLRMIPEKEVYLYALLRGIEFHDATCPYAERAQRGRFREILHRVGTRGVVELDAAQQGVQIDFFLRDHPKGLDSRHEAGLATLMGTESRELLDVSSGDIHEDRLGGVVEVQSGGDVVRDDLAGRPDQCLSPKR